MKKLWAAAAMTLALGLTQPAAAQTTTIGNNATGNAAGLEDGLTSPAQSLQAPAGYPWIHSYSVWIRRTSPLLSVQPVIYEWTGPTTLGPVVWTGAPTPVTEPTFEEFEFHPDTRLDPAKTYLLSVRQVTPGEYGRVQADTTDTVDGHYVNWRGSVWSEVLGAELRFTATFGVASAAPAAIPTLSEWALILLGVLLAGGAALTIQRRRAA